MTWKLIGGEDTDGPFVYGGVSDPDDKRRISASGAELVAFNLKFVKDPYVSRYSERSLEKIDMADEIFVINRNGCIGDSTKSEIQYVIDHGKKSELFRGEIMIRIGICYDEGFSFSALSTYFEKKVKSKQLQD